tara:strand:+ start:3010 stop:3741 length:732 start_codon:yes stop_codon:yes gene_type:complete
VVLKPNAMTETSDIRDREIDLASELAFHVMRRLLEQLKYQLDANEGHFPISLENPWKRAFWILEEIYIFELDSIGFRPVVEHRDVHKHVRSLKCLTKEHLNILLTSFIELTGEFSSETTHKIEFFSVGEPLEDAMNLLIAEKYAERFPLGILWTTKILKFTDPYLSDFDKKSAGTERQKYIVTNMLESMSFFLKRKLIRAYREGGQKQLLAEMRYHWTGKKWTYFKGSKSNLEDWNLNKGMLR